MNHHNTTNRLAILLRLQLIVDRLLFGTLLLQHGQPQALLLLVGA